MRVVPLLDTELSTSRLGFGTSGLHQLLRSRDRQELLAAAFDAGIRHFDTAPFYGHGIAERELGNFIQRCRSSVLVATKFGIQANPVLRRAPWLMYAQLAANSVQRKLTKKNWFAVKPSRDYSAREAQMSLERSLRALRTDHVDIYFIHEPCASLLDSCDSLLAALDRLLQQGKTRYIGLAGGARDCIDIAKRFPPFAQIMQISAAAGAGELQLVREAGLPCHFSFGHFRDRRAPIPVLLNDAATQNKTGVVLYSSRHTARVREVATYFSELYP